MSQSVPQILFSCLSWEEPAFFFLFSLLKLKMSDWIYRFIPLQGRTLQGFLKSDFCLGYKTAATLPRSSLKKHSYSRTEDTLTLDILVGKLKPPGHPELILLGLIWDGFQPHLYSTPSERLIEARRKLFYVVVFLQRTVLNTWLAWPKEETSLGKRKLSPIYFALQSLPVVP